MTIEERRRYNRLLVAVRAAVPSPKFGSMDQALRTELARPWPCKKDHSHDQMVLHKSGEWRCKACEAEARAANRAANRERERLHYKRRYRERKTAAA